MANELQTKLDAILLDKNTNLLPENLKKDITCLGITGTLEAGSGSSNIKLYSTLEELHADTPENGTIGVVYNLVPVDASAKVKANAVYLPNTVTLDTSLVNTTHFIQGFNKDDVHVISAELDGNNLYVSYCPSAGAWQGQVRQLYSGVKNGTVYTLTKTTSEEFWFLDDDVMTGFGPVDTIMVVGEQAKNQFPVYNLNFQGVYYYNETSSWTLIPNQLTANKNDILLGKTSYTKNGVETGALDLTTSKDVVILPAYSCSALIATETEIQPSSYLLINKSNFPEIGDKRWAIFTHKDMMREYWTHVLVVFENDSGYYKKIGTGSYRYEPQGSYTCYGGRPVGLNDPVDFLSRTNSIENIVKLKNISSEVMQIWENYEVCIGVFESGLISTNCEIQASSGATIIPSGTKASNVSSGSYYINAFGEKVQGTYEPNYTELGTITPTEYDTAVATTEDILGNATE